MTLWHEAAAATALIVASPLLVWAERKAKAWSQARRGPSLLQPYRDLRRLLSKRPVAPDTATRFWRIAPWLSFAAIFPCLLLLPLYADDAGLGASVSLLVLALLLTLQRAVLAAQAYDTATAFGGIGSSRELFLGALGEPVLLLVSAAVYLETGAAAVGTGPLPWQQPASWLIIGALGFAWLAEAARIPFDNPATHLELTMVHEALILEANGWVLAVHEAVGALKQTVLAVLLILFAVPLPDQGVLRVALLAAGAVALSGVLAVVESTMAKVRLFRASHLLIMATLLAFLAGVVWFVASGVA